MGDVEQAATLSYSLVLGDDAGVLERHVPPTEFGEFGP